MTRHVEPVAGSARFREKSRVFPTVDQPSKKPCLFQPTFYSSPGVEWYRPQSGWFDVIADPLPPRPLKRGRDSVDDLTASMKRLRTNLEEEEEEEVKKSREREVKEREVKESEHKEPISTALVLARPQARDQYRLSMSSNRSFSFDPDYSLPPPAGSFPVVLYKGSPSPRPTPKLLQSIEKFGEELSLLSRDNRTLKVSPSMTIELVDDDEDETLASLSTPTGNQTRSEPTMTDDD